MSARRKARKVRRVRPLDLDAVKRSGLNTADASAALLAAHWAREREELARELSAKHAAGGESWR